MKTHKNVARSSTIGSAISKKLSSIVLLVGLAASFPAFGSLMDGLVAYYPFEGSANDASGNGHNGTVMGGVSYGSGAMGQAANFDGVTGYIQIDDRDVGNLGDNGTLAFWFKAAAGNSPSGRIFEKDDKAYWWFLAGQDYVATDIHARRSYGGPPSWHLMGATSDTRDNWTAVALRKSGTTLDLFVDGILAQTVASEATDVVTDAPMTFGRSYYWGTFFYEGGVDEARVYERALTNSEIMELAGSGDLSAVPEPGTLLLVLTGFLAVAKRFRGRVRRPGIGR